MTMRMLKKIGSILKDESGAALVVTVSVFLFIYLAILGVYAIGMNVRNRIHIQNACDAAAYSAAVVQADALSRIATLNRAMSWTYCQMVKRQMDYVVHQWLDAACRRYQGDVNRCNSNGRRGCGGHLKWNWVGASEYPNVWDLNKMNILVNGNLESREHYLNVKSTCEDFRDRHLRGASFYSSAARQTSGIQRLRNQISADKNNIQGFNNAIKQIKSDLVGKATANAVSVWRANVPAYLSNLAAIWVDMQNPTNYMRGLSRETEEARFRNFVSHNPDDLSLCDFTPRAWFKLVRGEKEPENPSGFRRRYTGGLLAEWKWRWEHWRCHRHKHPLLRWAEGTTRVRAEDVEDVMNVYFSELDANKKPVIANPKVLKREYFGSAGTITVGIAVPNSNPFARIIGSVSGIFSAFNPGVTKTVCFSSAKAGYCKTLGGNNEDRRYSVDWDPRNQSWNLCQSDWDAVFVPVRRAMSKAEKGTWQDDVMPFLGELTKYIKITEDDFKAGKKVMSSKAKYVKYLEYDKDGVGGGEVGWRVKNQEAAVDWDELHNRMFH